MLEYTFGGGDCSAVDQTQGTHEASILPLRHVPSMRVQHTPVGFILPFLFVCLFVSLVMYPFLTSLSEMCLPLTPEC